MNALPFVTIAMPCRNEERSLETCLRSVLAQDYPPDRLEVLVADGMSVDRTRDILARFCREDPRVEVIDSPAHIQAAAMNAILGRARGEIIVRMDVHCEYRQDYVRRCVETLERTGADNVGGAQRARAGSLFQKALCAALDSPLGVGGARYRCPDREGFVDTVFLGAFHRRVLERVGGYDPGAVTNEDAELNQRILASGGRIYLSRDIVVHYQPRGSFRALARQYFRYGKGRARTLVKHGGLPCIRPVLPFLAVLAATVLLVTSPIQPITPWVFSSYALAASLEALRVSRGRNVALAPLVWAIFPVLHVSHGLGFAAGLLRYTLKPDWQARQPPAGGRPAETTATPSR